MSITGKEYNEMVKKASPPSPKIKNFIMAFLIGGLICAFGEGLAQILEALDISKKNVDALVPIILIVLTAILTAIGVFDKIARHAGAVRLPLNGFWPIQSFTSNGVSESRKNSRHGSKYFKIAGPVIVYGSATAIIYGIIYYFASRLGVKKDANSTGPIYLQFMTPPVIAGTASVVGEKRGRGPLGGEFE
jgi:stage V sporulation protein AC